MARRSGAGGERWEQAGFESHCACLIVVCCSSLCESGLTLLLFPHVPAQALFFLGSMIPYPMPWIPAPFDQFMTQPTLKEAWGTILWGMRAVALWDLGIAALCWRWGGSLVRAQARHEEALAKKSKRGSAVHSRIESYENGIGQVREQYSPPPLPLLVLLHLALSFGFHRLPSLHLFAPLEITQWSCDLVSLSHLLWAVSNLICFFYARSIWGGAAGKTETKAAAVKAE